LLPKESETEKAKATDTQQQSGISTSNHESQGKSTQQ
jgi:hypothetical protein